jgi:hypothetical protein
MINGKKKYRNLIFLIKLIKDDLMSNGQKRNNNQLNIKQSNEKFNEKIKIKCQMVKREIQ